jgi:cytochrome c peroxidase
MPMGPGSNRRTIVPFLCVGLIALPGCGGGSGGGSGAGENPVPATMSALALLGEKIFADPSLSASGTISCQTCHSPDRALASPANEAVPVAGASLDVPGFRNAPSLRYVAKTPPFSIDSDGAPAGGFDRDGRANTLAEQARRPFLAEHEMANQTVTDVSDKLSHATYAADFTAIFGADIFDQPQLAFERALTAIARYETEDPDFAPFDSKYDAFLAGRTQLTAAELRGLALFNDPQKGNCAACHPSGRGAGGEPPMFTDFSYDNLGVPRNAAIPANDDPTYFDLGLCGPFRDDLATVRDLCGGFKVPTLRNIALTAPYFHNGRFATLTEALSFYVRRDTNPEAWYPADPSGQVHKFDDLPPQYAANVNTTEVPYNRKPGDAPALNAAEIADVVAFLQTLTDGFQP